MRCFIAKKISFIKLSVPLTTVIAFLFTITISFINTSEVMGAVNYTEIRFDASAQAGGNTVTQQVNSTGVPAWSGTDTNWALSMYDNCEKYLIANFAIISSATNPEAGYSNNNGVITYTGNRGPGEMSTKQYMDVIINSGAKPVVFFHGVPASLCTNGFEAGPYGYNKNLPSDTNLTNYRNYVRAVAQYLADNYGVEEISKWAYEFASEPNMQLLYDATQVSKAMDYWLAGLEDVIGAGNVYAGTYFSYEDTVRANSIMDHFGTGTNYCTGQTGTRLAYMGWTGWVWNNADLDLHELKGKLMDMQGKFNNPTLKNNEYRTMEYGRGEPGIVVSWADQFGASFYAYQNDVYTQIPLKKNMINFGDWGIIVNDSETNNCMLTPAFNMYRIEKNIAGQRLLPVSIAGTKANTGNIVGGYASALDESTSKYNLIIYNFNTDEATNISENVQILLDNLPGTQATVKEYVIDSSRNNWWSLWRQHRETNNGVPYVDRTGYPVYPSWTFPSIWDIYQTTDSAGFAKWLQRGPAYKTLEDLYVTHGPTTVNINDGILQLNRTLPGHSVLYITVETSPTATAYGTNTGFESLNGWTTGGTTALSTAQKKEGTYSIKLSGMNLAQAYAKQTVTGLTAGKRYTLSGWAKPNGTRMEYGIYMQQPGNNSSRVTCNGLISPLQEWNRMAVTLEADANGQLEIGVIAPQQVNQKDVYFDALRLQRSGADSETCQEMAHFKLDENSGLATTDASIHIYTGNINGAAWTAGKYGSALYLDGVNDYVGITNQTLNIGSDFSITGWIKAPQDRGKYHVIVAKGPKDMGHFEAGIDPEGKLYFYANDMGHFTTNDTFDDDSWHHFAIIRKGNRITLYKDKIESYSEEAANFIVTENENIRIGTLVDGNFPFKGIIDDLQIFSGSLTTTQLNSVYSGNEPINRTPPVPIALSAENPAPGLAPTAAPAPTPTPVPNNVIGSWNLNENGGGTVYDLSVSGCNGLMSGAVWGAGKYGNALIFDGINDYVNFSNTGINIGNNFSISAWVKAPQDRNKWHVILAKGAKDSGHFELNLDPSGYLRFWAYDIGDFGSNTVIDDNNWHHVVVTYDGSNIKFYVDGGLKSASAASGTIANETETMRFGALTDGNFPYSGLLDEVKIYNKALSTTEIFYLLNNTTNFNNTIYAEYLFNENTGDTVNDTSVIRTNGIRCNAAWGSGRYGSALYFNGTGTDCVDIYGTTVNVGNNFSISAWIKPIQDRSKWHMILAKGPKDTGHFELNISPSGELRFYANDMGDYGSGVVVDDNAWHHVVVTCDGSYIRFYVDNALRNTLTSSGYVVSEQANMRIGLLADTSASPFYGWLDEIKILDHALTATEINELYNGR